MLEGVPRYFVEAPARRPKRSADSKVSNGPASRTARAIDVFLRQRRRAYSEMPMAS